MRRRSRRAQFGCQSLEQRLLFAAGDLDTHFSGDGVLPLPAGTNVQAIHAAADGKTVVVGPMTFFETETYTGVRRYTATGQPDLFGFFGDGVDYTQAIQTPTASLVQSDQKIVVAGRGTNGFQVQATITRFGAFGGIDTNFGTNGVVTIPGFTDVLTITQQADKRLLLFAHNPDQPYTSALVRLNENGTPDTSFSGDGVFPDPLIGTGFPAQPTFHGAEDVHIKMFADGDFVLSVDAGHYGPSGEPMLYAFKAGGTRDTSVNSTGAIPGVIPFRPYGWEIADLDVQSDDTIYAAGYTYTQGVLHAAVWKFKLGATGLQFAQGFGAGPGVPAAHAGFNSPARAIDVRPDGKILVTSGDEQRDEFGRGIVLARLTSEGVIDDTFGASGFVQYHTGDLPDSGDHVRDSLIRADGSVDVAATLADQPGSAYVARFIGDGPMGSVTGTIFNDLDRNWTLDAGEPPLSGVTVFLDKDNDRVVDADEWSTTSAANGGYLFTNIPLPPQGLSIAVVALDPLGYYNPQGPGSIGFFAHLGNGFPPDMTGAHLPFWSYTPAAVIQGRVYDNPDLLIGASPRPVTSVAGRTVYLDTNNNGALDTNERSMATSLGSGGGSIPGYRFEGVAPGTYVVRTIVPVGSIQAVPSLNAARVVTVAGSAVSSDNDFHTTQQATGSILGAWVFDDYDANGVADQLPFPRNNSGRTVLLDVDRDGFADPGEPTALTDFNGFVAFRGIAGGTYQLKVMPQTGSEFTIPSTGARTLTVPDRQVNNGEFGYRPATAVTPVTLRSTADAYVRDGSSAATNFGAAAELQLKKSASAGSTREFYLKFDLSSAASVASAKLRLWGRIDSSTQAPQVAVYPIANTSWAEGTINWNTRPQLPVGVNALATQTVATSTQKWYEFDVTSYLAAEKAAGRNTVTLLVRSLAATDPYLIFSSDESATNQPQLVVTPNGGTPPPPPQGLVVSTTGISVPEASQTGFTVKLATQPASNVLVAIARTAGDTDLSVVAPTILTFTTANWNTPQSVFIAAAEDADTTNGSGTITVSSSGLTSKTLTATEVDNDTPTNPGTPVTLGALADAYVRDGSSAATNFGNTADLQLKKSTTAGSTREFYLKFDLTSAVSVASAKLRLWGRIDSSTQAPQVSVYPIANTNWAEGTINWNNRPQLPVGVNALATQTVATSTQKWYEFDLSTYIAAEKAAGRNTVTLLVRSLAATDPYLIFNSDEATANKPQLVVTPNSGPPPQGLVVSTTALSVPEGGSNSFTVKLAAQPASNVIVNVARTSGDTDLSTGSSSLTFTAANWNVAQTVQISAAQDADTTNGAAQFLVSSTGLASKSVTATEADDDAPAGPTVLRAAADAYVRDGSSAATNFGSAAELQLKKSSSAGSTREFYLKFDLSSVASVASAKLRLWGRIDSSTQTPQVAVYAIANTSWAEGTINWNNRPQLPAGVNALAMQTVATSTQKWYEFDVSAYIAAEKAAGRNTVTLLVRSLAATDPYLIFNSDEAASNRPELVVT